jgi:trehalose-6-phosphate synthase
MNSSPDQLCRTDEGTVVIIANRGPHDFVREDGQWVAKVATGGLMSMIEPLARQPNVAWFCCVSEPPGSEAERDALYTTAKIRPIQDLNVVPVPLPASLYQDYYGEISNEVLWMLQHHLVGQFGYALLDERRHLAWESYLEAKPPARGKPSLLRRSPSALFSCRIIISIRFRSCCVRASRLRLACTSSTSRFQILQC